MRLPSALNNESKTLSGIAYPGAQLASVMSLTSEIITETLGRLFKRGYNAVVSWGTHRQTAIRLSNLNAHILADIGLSAEDVESYSYGWISLDELTRRRKLTRRRMLHL